MKKIPTDLEIITAIYERYYTNFSSYSKDGKSRSTKVYVPVDLDKIARQLDSDPFIIFGRLYNYLNQKYSYENDDGSKVRLFALQVADDSNFVHFPLMTSILADLQLENNKLQRATIFSTISAIVSVISLLISLTSVFINLRKK